MGKAEASVEELVNRIEAGQLRLPEMQRRYVWRSPRVRDLLDSLYRGYPSGAILLWETNEEVPLQPFAVAQQANPFQNTQLLLDGQQRLTSLSAVIRGEPVTVRGRKKPLELLFNLEHPDHLAVVTEVNEEADDDEENPDEEDADSSEDELQKRFNKMVFVVATKKLEQLPQWVKVTDVFKSVGTRVDFDEISGKGMQMFMISAQGTAVHAVATPIDAPDAATTLRIPGTAVRDQIRKDSILRRLPAIESSEQPVTEEFLETLCDARLPEAAPLCVCVALSDDQLQNPRSKQLAKQALRLSPRSAAREAIHEMILESQQASGAIGLYRDLGLLDLRWVLQQIFAPYKHARHVGLQVLCHCVATTYSEEDIAILRALADAVPKAFPETAREVEVKSLLGGQGRKWRCEHGHDNSLEHLRCSVCDIDRYGLPRGYSPDTAAKIIASTLAMLESHFRPQRNG